MDCLQRRGTSEPGRVQVVPLFFVDFVLLFTPSRAGLCVACYAQEGWTLTFCFYTQVGQTLTFFFYTWEGWTFKLLSCPGGLCISVAFYAPEGGELLVARALGKGQQKVSLHFCVCCLLCTPTSNRYTIDPFVVPLPGEEGASGSRVADVAWPMER